MRYQSGLSLLEVLLAMLIINLGVFDLMHISLTNLRALGSNYYHLIAVIRVAALNQRLQIASSSQQRYEQFNQWQKINEKLLPAPHGKLQCASYYCELRFSWRHSAVYNWKLYYPS